MRVLSNAWLVSSFLGAAVLSLSAPAAADTASCDNMMADGMCSNPEPCTCDDCVESPKCGACDTADTACTTDDACTCAECDTDDFCSDPTNCDNNGECNQFFEGCICADCAMVPNCLDNVPVTGGAGGSGGSATGGSSMGGSGGSATGGTSM